MDFRFTIDFHVAQKYSFQRINAIYLSTKPKTYEIRNLRYALLSENEHLRKVYD